MLCKVVLVFYKRFKNCSTKVIRRYGAARNPIHQIGVGFPHQGLELDEFLTAEAVQMAFGESAQYQVALLSAPMPGLVEEAFTSDDEVIHDKSFRPRTTNPAPGQ